MDKVCIGCMDVVLLPDTVCFDRHLVSGALRRGKTILHLRG